MGNILSSNRNGSESKYEIEDKIIDDNLNKSINLYYQVKENSKEEFLQYLKNTEVPFIRDSVGYLALEVYSDINDENRIVIWQMWDTLNNYNEYMIDCKKDGRLSIILSYLDEPITVSILNFVEI